MLTHEQVRIQSSIFNGPVYILVLLSSITFIILTFCFTMLLPPKNVIVGFLTLFWIYCSFDFLISTCNSCTPHSLVFPQVVLSSIVAYSFISFTPFFSLQRAIAAKVNYGCVWMVLLNLVAIFFICKKDG